MNAFTKRALTVAENVYVLAVVGRMGATGEISRREAFDTSVLIAKDCFRSSTHDELVKQITMQKANENTINR